MDTVDNSEKIYVKEVVACPHIPMVNNPLLSTTPNVVLRPVGSVYLVVEESKIKLLCHSCLQRSLFGAC